MQPYRKCVAIFLIKDSKVFAGSRVDIRSAWQLPQGGVEEGESLLDAAKRELFEETNVSSTEFLGMSASYYYDFPLHIQQIIIRKRGRLKYKGQEITFIAFKFLGDEKEINIEKTPQEFMEWKWESPQKLLHQIVSFKKKAYGLALEEFIKNNYLG
ncbi:MAG: RNA pyrophosphohydrolase [Holosporaceae bacterium]|jgi:putative (di)nucleoside polyphosphate hydrolase|nr:RNA pyrophosphohydrolase [Holosporaceae bacterium]